MVGNSQKGEKLIELNHKVINTEYWEWWAVKEEPMQVEVKGMMCRHGSIITFCWKCG